MDSYAGVAASKIDEMMMPLGSSCFVSFFGRGLHQGCVWSLFGGKGKQAPQHTTYSLIERYLPSSYRSATSQSPTPDSFLDDKVGAANCHDTLICLSVESHLFDEVVPDLGLGGAIAGSSVKSSSGDCSQQESV